MASAPISAPTQMQPQNSVPQYSSMPPPQNQSQAPKPSSHHVHRPLQNPNVSPILSPAQAQKILDENNHIINCILEYQNRGRGQECFQLQQNLHRNLVYLASAAETNPNLANILPPPIAQNGSSISLPPQQQSISNNSGYNQSNQLHGASPPTNDSVNSGNKNMVDSSQNNHDNSNNYNNQQPSGQTLSRDQPIPRPPLNPQTNAVSSNSMLPTQSQQTSQRTNSYNKPGAPPLSQSTPQQQSHMYPQTSSTWIPPSGHQQPPTSTHQQPGQSAQQTVYPQAGAPPPGQYIGYNQSGNYPQAYPGHPPPPQNYSNYPNYPPPPPQNHQPPPHQYANQYGQYQNYPPQNVPGGQWYGHGTPAPPAPPTSGQNANAPPPPPPNQQYPQGGYLPPPANNYYSNPNQSSPYGQHQGYPHPPPNMYGQQSHPYGTQNNGTNQSTAVQNSAPPLPPSSNTSSGPRYPGQYPPGSHQPSRNSLHPNYGAGPNTYPGQNQAGNVGTSDSQGPPPQPVPQYSTQPSGSGNSYSISS